MSTVGLGRLKEEGSTSRENGIINHHGIIKCSGKHYSCDGGLCLSVNSLPNRSMNENFITLKMIYYSEFVWLVGFLTSSTAARLYCGRVPRLTSDNFTWCHTRDRAGRP